MTAPFILAPADLAKAMALLNSRVEALEALFGDAAADSARRRAIIDQAIEDFHAQTAGTPADRVRRLTGLVSEEWGVAQAELLGPARDARIVRPRFVLGWLLRRATGWSYPVIARHIGRSDHTSVIYAERRVEGWRERQPDFRLVTDQLLTIANALFRPPPEHLAAEGGAE